MFDFLKKFFTDKIRSKNIDHDTQPRDISPDRTIIDLNNTKPSVSYALNAEVQRKTGCYEEALISVQKAIVIDPYIDMYYITQSLIYKQLTDYNAALESINKAIKLNPGYINAQEIREEILKIINK